MDNTKLLLSILILFMWALLVGDKGDGLQYLGIELSLVGAILVGCVPVMVIITHSSRRSWKIEYFILCIVYVLSLSLYCILFELGSKYVPYQLLKELPLLSIVFFLSIQLAQAMEKVQTMNGSFREVMANNRAKIFQDALDDINMELDRSRRHEYPVSFVSLSIDEQSFKDSASKIQLQINRDIAKAYLKKKIGTQLSLLSRNTDILIDRQGRSGFYIVCPQTDEKNIESFIHKLMATLVNEWDLTINCGSSTFPEDSVNVDELLTIAEMKKPMLSDRIYGKIADKPDQQQALSKNLRN